MGLYRLHLEGTRRRWIFRTARTAFHPGGTCLFQFAFGLPSDHEFRKAITSNEGRRGTAVERSSSPWSTPCRRRSPASPRRPISTRSSWAPVRPEIDSTAHRNCSGVDDARDDVGWAPGGDDDGQDDTPEARNSRNDGRDDGRDDAFDDGARGQSKLLFSNAGR